jgi:uncharacterized Zn finger protein (UPF0148 family)
MQIAPRPEKFREGRTAQGDPAMRRFANPLLLLLCALFLLSSCASTKVAKEREWKPGDTVICPHCGREFPVPEKLGK